MSDQLSTFAQSFKHHRELANERRRNTPPAERLAQARSTISFAIANIIASVSTADGLARHDPAHGQTYVAFAAVCIAGMVFVLWTAIREARSAKRMLRDNVR